MKEFLRVKAESLLLEARYIKFEESQAKYKAAYLRTIPEKAKYAARFTKANQGLHLHRIVDVRKEARWTNLAVGFLNGKKYSQIEPLAYCQPNWERVERLIMKYSEKDSRITAQKFAEWKSEALGTVKEKYVSSIQPGSHRGRWTEWMHHCMERKVQQEAPVQELTSA